MEICLTSRDVPNSVESARDDIDSIKGGIIRYAETDVKKMNSVSKDERIAYRRMLRDAGKYTEIRTT